MYDKPILRKRRSRTSVIIIFMVFLLVLSVQKPVYATQTVQIRGNADVVIRAYEVSHSSSADASIEPDGSNCVVLHADLSKPGEWAEFAFTVENTGSADVVLSDVAQFDHTPKNIITSFGISEKDVGEILKPGETCSISIVVQVNPDETENISVKEDFSLTLTYEAMDMSASSDETDGESEGTECAPETGDISFISLTAYSLMLFSAVTFILLMCRYRKTDDA